MFINALGTILTTTAAYTNYIAAGANYSLRIGTDKNDIFQSVIGDTMKGGKGDDTYYLWSSTSQIVENASEGIDTAYVAYWGKAVLADNVENMILASPGATAGTGNALDNVITAGIKGATLNGKGGNDVLVGGAGADLFVVEKGNGSDAIVNFKPGTDSIALQGYGLTSFAQISAAASQVGSDVSIALGGGEKLVIRGVSLSSLHAADFGLLEASQIRATSDQSLLTKWNNTLQAFDTAPITLAGAAKGWTANGWTLVNNMWGTGGLKDGVDFTINSTFSRGNMTKDVTFNWSVPYTTEYMPGIKGYPEVSFGVAPKGNYAANPTDKATTFPIKVSDLQSLTANYDVSFSGTTSGFNVSYDIWLTNVPNGGPSTISNEVMVWVHKGDFDAPGTKIGTYSVGGVNGTLYNIGTYTALVLDQDVPAGSLDITGLLAKLQTLGVVKPTEYLAAVELGAEMVSGVGSLTINNLDLTVISRGANGTLITKQVNGAGATVTETTVLASKLAAGTEQVVDAHGTTLTKVTTMDATDKASVQYLDKTSKLVGYDTVRVDGTGVMTTQHFTASGKMTGADIVRTGTDKSVSTEHFDANWVFTGSDVVRVNADGSSTTYHYDANWKLATIDAVVTASTGTTTYHYDGNWKLLNMDTVQTAKDGSSTTYHYDASWKMVSIDVVQVAAGKTTTYHYNASWVLNTVDVAISDGKGGMTYQHYDKNWKILSADTVVNNADGSVTSTHYNSSWGITGIDVAKTDANGVTSTTHYNSKWVVVGVDHEGSGGVDTLVGAATVTNLHGGRGSDILISGGAAATNFWFDTPIGKGDVDQISKFASAKDGIYLSQSIFSGIKSLGDLSASAFEVGKVATTADTRILFDKASGNLFYDADGNGAGSAVLFAHLDSDKLTAANFHVVG